MTLTLHRIELFNFRSHEHFIFEPDLEGITAISGQNGAGKSTIVDAFAWALYGTRPSKVTNKMLIRDGASIKNHNDRVEAIIDITINKIDYRVSRKITSDGGGVECRVFGKSGDADYNILAGPAVSSAEAYIKQIMGMDEKGFLTSVLIQQKQVDQIVSSSPRDRAAVIEKLTGISAVTEAIDLSRAETKAYQRAADVITVKDSESIKKEIETIIAQGKDLKSKIEEETTDSNKKKNLISRMRTQLQKDTDNYNLSEDISNKENLSRQNQKMLNDESKRITEELLKYKRSHSSSTVISDPKPLKTEYDKELSIYLNLKNEVSSLTSTIESNKSKLLDNKDFINTAGTVKQTQQSLITEIDKITNTLNSFDDKMRTLQSSKKQSKKALGTISTGDMVCPVCKRPIDNPEDLVKELNSELDNIASEEKALKKEITVEKKNLQASNEKLDKINDDLAKLQDLDTIKNELPSQNVELSNKTAKMIELKSRVDILNKDYDKAVKEFLNKEDLDNKKKRLETINNQLGAINSELSSYESQLKTINSLKKSELNARKKKTEDMSTEYNQLIISLNQHNSNYKYMQTRYKDLRTQYDEAVEAQQKYESLTNKMKTAAVSTKVMSDFKIDRIKFAVPTIEMYASTILSQFTDSKFTQLKLDGKFNASVITSEGEERPIAQLSGGELSAAAIALRLSISMLLNGADKNVIIFDEVLVSMDESRARKIMETISSVTNSQIIFIAHNADIDSVADLVVQIGNKEGQED